LGPSRRPRSPESRAQGPAREVPQDSCHVVACHFSPRNRQTLLSSRRCMAAVSRTSCFLRRAQSGLSACVRLCRGALPSASCPPCPAWNMTPPCTVALPPASALGRRIVWLCARGPAASHMFASLLLPPTVRSVISKSCNIPLARLGRGSIQVSFKTKVAQCHVGRRLSREQP